MLFRIFTENLKADEIGRAASARFESCTTYHARGWWKGAPEESLVVEVVGPVEWRRKVRRFAKWIKRLNRQEAVLVEELRNHSELV